MSWSERVDGYLNAPVVQVWSTPEVDNMQKIFHFHKGRIVAPKIDEWIRVWSITHCDLWYLYDHGAKLTYPAGDYDYPEHRRLFKINKKGLVSIEGGPSIQCKMGGAFTERVGFYGYGKEVYYSGPNGYDYEDLRWRLPWVLYQVMVVEFDDLKKFYNDIRGTVKVTSEKEVELIPFIANKKPLDHSQTKIDLTQESQESWMCAMMIWGLCGETAYMRSTYYRDETPLSMHKTKDYLLEKFYPSSAREMHETIIKWIREHDKHTITNEIWNHML